MEKTPAIYRKVFSKIYNFFTRTIVLQFRTRMPSMLRGKNYNLKTKCAVRRSGRKDKEKIIYMTRRKKKKLKNNPRMKY